MRRVDIVVAGLGGIGSAALYHAAVQGLEAVGLEQFDSGHDRGSSHGESRIFRLAYFEDPAYVPMALHALDGWRRLEALTGRDLMVTSGGLDLGPPDGRLVPGSLRSCELHGLRFEHWSPADLRSRAPTLRLPADVEAIYQPDAAILRPAEGVQAHLQAARGAGAEVREQTRMIRWEPEGDGVRITLGVPDADGGETEESLWASRLILTTGAWMGGHLTRWDAADGDSAPAAATVRPERQVVGWLPATEGAPARGLPDQGAFPVVNAELEGGHVYFMPPFDGLGIKVGLYHHRNQEISDPDQRDAAPDEDDRALLQGLADRYLAPGGRVVRMRSCRFNLSPDEHFLVDRISGGRVIVGGGFSGHGYKFAPALGECLANLARNVALPVPIDAFSLDRFRRG